MQNKIKIGFIPIDNRPICYDIVEDIVKINSSIELFMPDIPSLGGLVEPAKTDNIFDFLKKLDADYLIVSLDTLTYGGLVSSRRCSDSFDEIKNKILKFKNIMQDKKCKILAFSSVMRISNNNINEEEKEYWNKFGKEIFSYSYNLHNAFENKLPLPKPNVPREILDDYLNTRKRNFEINKFYIELAKEGFFDTLIFSKDDCAKYGFNVHEAQLLARNSIDLDNVFIKTGADEIPLSLLSRALSNHLKLKVNLEFLNPNSTNLISKYEDISVLDCVKGQLLLANIDIDKNNYDLNFVINNFKDEQGDLVLGEVINKTEKNTDLNNYLPCFAADINNANGSDIGFVQDVLKISKSPDFYGYCAYNTSANTIGASLCSAVVKNLAVKNNTYNDEAFKKLQFIRFMDDYIFQAIIRKPIRENAPHFIEKLNEKKDELNNYAKNISEQLGYFPNEIKYSLPWDRSFEIRIKI